MKNKFIALFLLGFLFQMSIGCATQWTDVISSGKVSNQSFQETTAIEIQNGLLFIPVTIEGKSYRFLFDSGAPLSLSKELQNKFNFKTISKGSIVDSDGNRNQVVWVHVPKIDIGAISFTEQAAFIGDFEANPLFKCLNIDGIIGSNLQRFCNWTIDVSEMRMTLFKNIPSLLPSQTETIPFRTDIQYNIFMNLPIGQATVKNVLVDYGSNGSVALNSSIFSTLKSKNILANEPLVESGFQQSGIIGKPKELRREITHSDSIRIGDHSPEKVMVRTGKTVSVGTKLLSRYHVTINWEQQKLHFAEINNTNNERDFAGFTLGYSAVDGIYVQSVIEQSEAYAKGLRPLMKVTQLNQLDFENGADFCDYVNHRLQNEITLVTLDASGKRKSVHFTKTQK